MTNSFFIKVNNKSYWFVHTEKHWFDIIKRLTFKDGNIIEGLVTGAKEVSPQYVADLFSKSSKARGKASRIRKLRKEAYTHQ